MTTGARHRTRHHRGASWMFARRLDRVPGPTPSEAPCVTVVEASCPSAPARFGGADNTPSDPGQNETMAEGGGDCVRCGGAVESGDIVWVGDPFYRHIDERGRLRWGRVLRS